ncbi:MAG: DUF4148 domain-containing protein [Burkholderiaceae bacterium]|nr:MAG: DUF4148 domain-containing protein [Burkholderiaceae bacterium]
MSLRKITLAVLITGSLVTPMAAFANFWHLNNSEIGFTTHPEHLTNSKTRAQVQQELQQAKADGSWYYLQRGLPVPDTHADQGKTREQVQQELASMTKEEARRIQDFYAGA